MLAVVLIAVGPLVAWGVLRTRFLGYCGVAP
jgi:hypothetical protein